MINYALDCPHIFDGYNYEKTVYEAMLPDGGVVPCWPNAGSLVSLDGSGRAWKHSDRILCRKIGDRYWSKYLGEKDEESV